MEEGISEHYLHWKSYAKKPAKLRKLHSGLQCLVGLLVFVTVAGCNLRTQFVVFIMKCVDKERHET